MPNQAKLTLEWRLPSELSPNPENYKRHPHVQNVTLRDVIDEVGWAGTVLYNERTGRLIDGHARAKIARKNEKIPVLVGSWSEDEERKILATFDAIGAMAIADRSALEELLSTVKFESSAIVSMLEDLVGKANLDLKAGDDLEEPSDYREQADELQKKWKTEIGQVWNIEEAHRLACGDCTDTTLIARLLRKTRGERLIDLVSTDPPYGVAYGEKTAWMEQHGAQRRRTPITNDSLDSDKTQQLFAAALRLAAANARPGAAAYATVPSGALLPHFIAGFDQSGFTFKHSLVWMKNSIVLGRSDYKYQHETILYGWLENGAHHFTSDRSKSSVFQIDRPSASPLHPTTKPVQLFAEFILNSSRKGELVFDPFAGSGTTLLAAAQLDRVGYGIEVSPAYVAVSLERLSSLGMKPKLLK